MSQFRPSRKSVRFSRPTVSRSLGKRTSVLKTSVTDDCAIDFAKYAKDRGYQTVSDCLNEMVMVAVYGVDVLASLHVERLRSLAPNWTGTGTQVEGDDQTRA